MEVPKQVPSIQEQIQLQLVGESAADVFSTQVIISVILYPVLKSIAAVLWSMLNTLQLLTLLPSFEVTMPQNVIEVQQMILAVANSKMIPDGWIAKLFDWGPQDSFLRSSIQILIILAILALIIGLVSLLKAFCNCRCSQRLFSAIKDKLAYNSVIRTCLQTYLVTCTSMMTSLMATDLGETAGIVDFVLCLLTLAFCIAFPVIVFRFLRSNFD